MPCEQEKAKKLAYHALIQHAAKEVKLNLLKSLAMSARLLNPQAGNENRILSRWLDFGAGPARLLPLHSFTLSLKMFD